MGGEPTPTTIRVATPDDLGAVAGLSAEAAGRASDPTFQQCLGRWWAREGDRRTTWLAEAGPGPEPGSEPVGMVTLVAYDRMPQAGRPDSAWGYVATMYVRPAWRGRGVGARLLDALVAEATARGYAHLVLHPGDRAVPLYRRAGFGPADGSSGGVLLLVRA